MWTKSPAYSAMRAAVACCAVTTCIGTTATAQDEPASPSGANSGSDTTDAATTAAGADADAGTDAGTSADAGTRADAEATYANVLAYRRQSLQLWWVWSRHGWLPLPPVMIVGPTRALQQGGGWNPGAAFPAPSGLIGTPDDWLILRGATGVIDELEFARLLRDDALANRIEEARFWPRVGWLAGFGAAAIAGVGSGAWLYASANGDRGDAAGRRDQRALGTSLIIVGVASATLALMFPWMGYRHVLTAEDAQRSVDDYNQALRSQLKLSPRDLEACP